MIRKVPVIAIATHINGVMMRASRGTGVRSSSPGCGASEQSANAASVSMMILIQRISMMVNGSG